MPFVYFIQAGDDGPVKIGVTDRPDQRFSTIQSCCPFRLEFIGIVTGDERTEAAFHKQFAAHRTIGEWFNPAPEIIAAARALGLSALEHSRFAMVTDRSNPRMRLRAHRIQRRVTHGALAEKIGCTRQFIQQLESGTADKVPGLLLARRIEVETGIPAVDWDRIADTKHKRPATHDAAPSAHDAPSSTVTTPVIGSR